MTSSYLKLLSLQVQAILELLDFGNILLDDFCSSLDLNAICLVDPLSELEPETASVPIEAKLEVAKPWYRHKEPTYEPYLEST